MPKHWTVDEIDYLERAWGSVNLKTICKNILKTENAVKIKAFRLGLGAFLDCGDYITLNQLIKILGRGSGGYLKVSWINNRNLPVKNIKINNKTVRIITINDFWNWAEQNRTFIDFSKLDINILGNEPSWVNRQRENDIYKNIHFNKTPWTKNEDERLIYLVNQFKYSYIDISKKINRTTGAIQKRLSDLNIKARPVKADNRTKWTDEEICRIEKMIKEGVSYEMMSLKINKSDKAIRGLIYRIYNTEVLDKVIELINNDNQILD